MIFVFLVVLYQRWEIFDFQIIPCVFKSFIYKSFIFTNHSFTKGLNTIGVTSPPHDGQLIHNRSVITTLNKPTSLDLSWTSSWFRWDRLKPVTYRRHMNAWDPYSRIRTDVYSNCVTTIEDTFTNIERSKMLLKFLRMLSFICCFITNLYLSLVLSCVLYPTITVKRVQSEVRRMKKGWGQVSSTRHVRRFP